MNKKTTFGKFRRNIFSQNGEDGVIGELVRRIGIQRGKAVELGAWDGKHLSNTFALVQKNAWAAVYIEGDGDRFKDLLGTAAKNPGIRPVHAFVKPTGGDLDRIVREAGWPTDYDLLSIDVDGCDYQIWSDHVSHHPKVVVIEIVSSLPTDVEQVHDIERGINGSSFRSMLQLGHSKGYQLVLHTGNMIFVRSDLIPRLGLTPAELADPTILFDPDWLPKSFPMRILAACQRRLLRPY